MIHRPSNQYVRLIYNFCALQSACHIVSPSCPKFTRYVEVMEVEKQAQTDKNIREKANNFGKIELEFLNLIAELIVEIILKETKNECDRIRED